MIPPLYVVRILDGLAGEDGVFRLLAVDQRHSFRAVIEKGDPDSVGDDRLSRLKRDVVAALSPHCTGVLLDPEYVAAQVVHSGELAGSTGLIVTAEADGYYALSRGLPAELIPGWSIERTRQLGGQAVKVLVQFRPTSPELTEKDQEFAYRVFEECRRLELASVLEVLVEPGPGGSPEDSAALMIEAAERLSPASDLYKTPFPAPPNADAATATEWCRRFDEACAVPWVVLSAGASWDTFRRQLQIASEAGASGFLAGRSIWNHAVAVEPRSQRIDRLATVGVERLREINDLVGIYARPWRDRYVEDLAGDLSLDWVISGTSENGDTA